MGVFALLVLACFHILDVAEGTTFMVYPKDRAKKQQCTHTTDLLIELLKERNVRTYSSEALGVTDFWAVEADERERALII